MLYFSCEMSFASPAMLIVNGMCVCVCVTVWLGSFKILAI